MPSFRIGVVVLLSITWFGCQGGCKGTSTTPFDPTLGFQPIEPVTDATFPPPANGDPHPEALQTTEGSAPGWDWAHGAAYVHATVRDVYAALADPAVSRIHGPSWSVNGVTEAEFPVSFAIDYSDGNLFVTVYWTITYRGGVLTGTADAPVEVGLRYQKTHGTNYIPIQEGSVVASDAGDGVSALLFVCHLNAEGQGPDNVRGTVQDWFDDIVAKVHGNPVP
jgi:hypothetical protein